VSKRLIVNADDLGLTKAVTDGIFAAHEAGVLTSTSMMVNQPATGYAVAQLHKYPKLGVGIHLNTCQGRPTLPPEKIPSLVAENGEFLRPDIMARKLSSWGVSSIELQAEYRAQIRAAKALGIELTHADSHHHMHLFFGAVAPFRRALQAEGITRVRASRIRCWPNQGRVGGPHQGSTVRRLAVSAYMELLTATVLGSFWSPHCRVETHLDAGEVDTSSMVQAWQETLQAMPNGVFELVIHPAFPDPEHESLDRIHDKRVQELALLTSADFRYILRSAGVCLVSYADAVELPDVRSSTAMEAI
jgi:chitin disaccharide deacetylase